MRAILGVVAALLFLAFDDPATAEEGSWPTIRDALLKAASSRTAPA